MKRKSSILVIFIFLLFISISFYIFMYQNGNLPLSFYFQQKGILLKTCSTCNVINKTIYIATSEYQLTRGMMFQSNFQGAYGMLFVMNSSQQICMWMKNTQIPLERIWISSSGNITYIKNAMPYDMNITCAEGKYVLETIPGNIKYGGVFYPQYLKNLTD